MRTCSLRSARVNIARVNIALAIPLVLASGACAASSPDDVAPERVAGLGRSAAPLVDGTVDTAHPEALVLRKKDGLCSGALIAPTLYLTARHCTAVWTTQYVPCKVGTSGEGAASLPVYSGEIDAKEFSVGATQTSEALAGVVRIYTDGATTSCGHDLVVVELDKPLAIPPARVRRTPVAVGERLVLVGWGYTDRAAKVVPSQRMTGQTTVLGIGPVVQSYRVFGTGAAASVAVASGEIAVGALSTSGDSGGPAFDSEGAIAAIVARGFGPDPAQGPASYTTTAAHLDVIDRAFAGASSAPAGSDPASPAPSGGSGKAKAPGAPDQDGEGEGDGDANGSAATKSSPAKKVVVVPGASACSLGQTPQGSSPRPGPSSTALGIACAAALILAARSRRTAMR